MRRAFLSKVSRPFFPLSRARGTRTPSPVPERSATKKG